jgi:hypothetical protein
MTDVGPKIETKTFRNDLAIAQSDDTRLRHPLNQAFEHLSDTL